MTTEGSGDGNTGPNSLALRIANGHAYRKHVVRDHEYPAVGTPHEFAVLIDDVMTAPNAVKPLRAGRLAYWQDESATVVIVDPTHPDGGTAFRPGSGRTFFDSLQ